MRMRLLTAFVLGAGLGGFAAFYAAPQGELEFPHAVTGPETVRVLVAKRELNYGAQLTPKDLQWVDWPKAAVPPGSFTSVAALLGEKANEKRVVLRTIEPGEPVFQSKISKLGESPRMSFNLEDGKRAQAISVDASAGVAGFVAPGDHVDIILIRQLDGDLVSSIIMQDVPVIAVDQQSNAQTTGIRLFVTVEVNAAEAQKLVLAQQVGRLSLSLRGLPGSPNMVSANRLGDYPAPNEVIRLRRGDFGVPRGLCEQPPTAAPGETLCDVMEFPPWAP